MRLAPTLVAVAIAFSFSPPGCRQEPSKLEKLEEREKQLDTKIAKLRQKQQEIEQKLPELEDRLAQTRSAIERERSRQEKGTPEKKSKRTPTPAP